MFRDIMWIVLALIFFAAPARAEDREAARRAYADGTKYYDLSQYDDALEAFRRAYWNYEEPSFLFNIAQCQRALGRKKEAVDSYRSYLRKSADASNRDDVRKIIDDLEKAITHEKAPTAAPPQATLAAPTPSPERTVMPTHGRVAPTEGAVAGAITVPVVLAAPPAPKPAYKRAWVWCVIGGAVVAGAAVGLGVGLGASHAPTAADGIVRF